MCMCMWEEEEEKKRTGLGWMGDFFSFLARHFLWLDSAAQEKEKEKLGHFSSPSGEVGVWDRGTLSA